MNNKIINYAYTEKDLDLVSWDRVDKLIEKIYLDVDNYIKDNNLKIRYIAPVLRGGGVAAIKLSHMFNVIDMLPIQLKYDSTINDVLVKVNLDYIKDTNIDSNECILLVEANHVSGKTANIAANMIRDKFGNVKIIYVSLSRDYSYKDSVKDVCFSTTGMYTNETKNLSREECLELVINYDLVTVYPWENIEEELFELNNY